MLFRSSLAFGFVLFAAPLASAQGGLTATPNPYDASTGVALVIRNATADLVTIDSFTVASYDNGTVYVGSLGFAYQSYLAGGAVGGFVSCSPFTSVPNGGCSASSQEEEPFAPADSVALDGFGRYCDVCRGGPGGEHRDTLRVYANGSAEPLNVAISNVQLVASETAPEALKLDLTLSPNPTRGFSVLTLALPAPGPARIVAVDALGREVAVLHDGPAPEALTLRVDTSAWPPGVYVVRASAGERAASVRLVVAR